MQYLEVSAGYPIAVITNGERVWYDKLSDEEQVAAKRFRQYDLNRKRFLSAPIFK